MQLESAGEPTPLSGKTSPLRARLRAVAWLLLACGMPASARAQTAPAWQFDGSALVYREKGRAEVIEPVGRITRIFDGGQTLSAQFGLDAITGASPSGALPSGGTVQTTTTASGRVTANPVGQIPVSPFHDLRGSADLDWVLPLGGFLTLASSGHASREKDYQSLGASEKVSIACMHKLTTLTFGGGFNRDKVFPRGGTPAGLSDGSVLYSNSPDPKRVNNGLLGISRVLTRRWMMAVDASRTA